MIVCLHNSQGMTESCTNLILLTIRYLGVLKVTSFINLNEILCSLQTVLIELVQIKPLHFEHLEGCRSNLTTGQFTGSETVLIELVQESMS